MEHELSIYRLCHKAAPKEVEVGEVEAVEVEEVEVEVEVGEAEAAEAEEGALSEEVVEEVVAVVPAAFSHTALLNLTVKAVVVEA